MSSGSNPACRTVFTPRIEREICFQRIETNGLRRESLSRGIKIKILRKSRSKKNKRKILKRKCFEGKLRRLGYNKLGCNELGYNELGYNELGFNELGYNKLGYNELSYNERIRSDLRCLLQPSFICSFIQN